VTKELKKTLKVKEENKNKDDLKEETPKEVEAEPSPKKTGTIVNEAAPVKKELSPEKKTEFLLKVPSPAKLATPQKVSTPEKKAPTPIKEPSPMKVPSPLKEALSLEKCQELMELNDMKKTTPIKEFSADKDIENKENKVEC